MTIIFYGENDKIYIAAENKKMIILHKDDPTLLNHFDGDILYVQDAHYVTKQQFANFISGNFDTEYEEPPVNRFTGFMDEPQTQKPSTQTPKKKYGSKTKLYIHTTMNGTICLEDVKTKNFPDGVVLDGKWNFIPVDEIGEELLYESRFFKLAIQRRKIEVVGQEYVDANKHKSDRKMSPTAYALDKILVPADVKAKAAAEKSMFSDDDIMEIPVEAD